MEAEHTAKVLSTCNLRKYLPFYELEIGENENNPFKLAVTG